MVMFKVLLLGLLLLGLLLLSLAFGRLHLFISVGWRT